MKKLFILFIFICGCNSVEKKTKTKEISVFKSDRELLQAEIKGFLPDTSFTPISPKNMREYLKPLIDKFKNYVDSLKKEIKDDSTGYIIKEKIQLAGIIWDDYQQYIILKSVKNSPREESMMASLGFASPYNKLTSIEERLELFKEFPLAVQKSEAGIKTYNRLMEFSYPNVGRNIIMIQDFLLLSQMDGLTSYNSLFKNNKRKLIMFGASWCGPCVSDELKLLKNLPGVDTSAIEIIGFSIDKKKEDWFTYVSKYNIPWKTYILPDNMNNLLIKYLNFDGVPHCLFTDNKGNILKEHTSYEYVLP
jgi:thiol-disulfide isomerase/thioredoxin